MLESEATKTIVLFLIVGAVMGLLFSWFYPDLAWRIILGLLLIGLARHWLAPLFATLPK